MRIIFSFLFSFLTLKRSHDVKFEDYFYFLQHFYRFFFFTLQNDNSFEENDVGQWVASKEKGRKMVRKFHYSLVIDGFLFNRNQFSCVVFVDIWNFWAFLKFLSVWKSQSFSWWSIGWEIKAFTKFYHKIIYW